MNKQPSRQFYPTEKIKYREHPLSYLILLCAMWLIVWFGGTILATIN